MIESRFYLNFFKQHVVYFLLPGLVGLTAGFYYINSKPQQFLTKQAFEVNYQLPMLADQIALADQATANLRAQDLAGVTVYKNGPLGIMIESRATNNSQSLTNFQTAQSYLIKNFSLREVGPIAQLIISKNIALYLILGLAFGELIGVTILLIKIYFQKF